MIRAPDLITKFEYAYDDNWGYILGTAGTQWTDAKQAKVKNEMAKKYGAKWVGHMVADCSGLFVWAFRKLGGEIYHGSNTIWNKYLSNRGKLVNGQREDGMPLRPGTALFKTKGDDRHHIGLYIGDGKAIEAKGTQYGVVKSKSLTWDEWGELKDVIYEDMSALYKAVVSVKDNDSPVHMRAQPTASARIIDDVPEGQIVDVLGNVENKDNWKYIQYKNQTGYMMSRFLVPVDSEPVQEDMVTLTRTDYDEAVKALETALDALMRIK